MWKGEWKAYVFWWIGWPLIAVIVSIVAVCVIGRHRGRDEGRRVQQQPK